MTDEIMRDLIAGGILAVYIGLLACKQAIDPTLGNLAMIAFGYFFKGQSNGWSAAGIFKQTPKVVPILLVFLLMGSGISRADIFNPIPSKNQAFLSSINTPSSSTILTDAAAIINYLGVKEGEAYSFNQHKWVTTTGATLLTYTPWGIALDVDMLKTDGVVGAISWNAGSYLPSQNVPLLNVTQYLYFFGGSGAEQKIESDGSTPMKFTSVAGAEFKFSF